MRYVQSNHYAVRLKLTQCYMSIISQYIWKEKKKKREHLNLEEEKKACLHSQITLKIKVPCLLWILIQSHKHQEKLNSRCNVLLWTNRGWVSAAQERPTTTWAGRILPTGRGWLGSPISLSNGLQIFLFLADLHD